MQHPENSIVDALYRISRVVNETDDTSEALESIIDAIMDVLPAGSAAIELINPNTSKLEIEVYRGIEKSATAKDISIGDGITGWVALHGVPLYVPDVRLDNRYIELDTNIRSELAVPLKSEDGGILGVINVDSNHVDAFSEHHQKILLVLANEATRALARIWLIHQLRSKADHLQALIRTGRTIVSKRKATEILRQITQNSLSIINAKVSAVFLLDTDREHIVLRAAAGSKSIHQYSERLSLNDSAIGTAIRRRKSIEISNLPRTEEHHFLPIVQSEGLVSMLSCPIIFEREVIGVLNVYTDSPHRFHNEERNLCEALASLGAVAINNARLYKRIFESEENLRKTEKLTTLGLLSAEIAHEIRNPLTVIRLLFESLDLEFDNPDPRSKDVQIIMEKLDQLESIVSRVLSFGKTSQEIRSHIDLNTIVEESIHLVRLKLNQQQIEIITDFEAKESVLVDAHKGQIQQAILNLIINATQAMPEGGSIQFKTTIEISNYSHYACLRISDTGKGIDEGIKEKIFDSFLTGRPEGTGLGLAIVKRILRSHMGDVTVEKTSSAGTTMLVKIPLVNRN